MKKISIIFLSLLWWHFLSSQTLFDTLTINLKNEVRPSDKLTYILNYCDLNVAKYPKQIKTILEDAKVYITSNELEQRNAEYFYQCANYYSTIHIYDSAKTYYFKALNLVAENNLAFKSLLHTKIASISRKQYELPQAIDNIEIAINYSKLSNSSTLQADAMLELGNINCELELYNIALTNHQEAISKYKINNDTLSVTEGYLQIGNLFACWENYPMALDYYDKALTLYQKLKLPENVSATYLLLSRVYYKMGDISESLKFSDMAYNNYRYSENEYKLAPILSHIGLIEAKRKNFELSKNMLGKGFILFTENNDLLGKAEVLTNFGDLYSNRNNYHEAITKYKEALKLTEDFSYQSVRLILLEKLSDSYSNLADYKSAMNYQTQYYVLNQKKNVDKFQLKFSTLENKVTIEKKGLAAGQAELLEALAQERNKKKNWVISTISLLIIAFIIFAFYYTKTQKKLSEKDLLLSNKLIRLNRQQEYLQNLKSQIEELNKTVSLVFSVTTQNINEAVKKLRELIDISKSSNSNNELLFKELNSESFIMSYNLLENLLYFSRLQLEKIEIEPEEIEIKPLILDILNVQQPRALAKNIDITISIDDNITGYFDYSSIEIALRNIIENAIKFSTFESNVQIVSKKEHDTLIISIYDNGIGLTRDQLVRTLSSNKNYISQGTHGEKGGGLGLLLSKVFIERNFGTLTIESSIAIGTKVLIKLPGSKNSLIKNSAKTS